MRKRFLALLLCAGVLFVYAPRVQAASKLVAQKTSKTAGAVYLSVGLVAGHRYRIDVGAPTHRAFSGMGGQNYTYVANQHLFTASKPFQLKGTTPKSFSVTQSIKGKVTGWVLFMDVALAHGTSVTVRVYDLGTG